MLFLQRYFRRKVLFCNGPDRSYKKRKKKKKSKPELTGREASTSELRLRATTPTLWISFAQDLSGIDGRICIVTLYT